MKYLYMMLVVLGGILFASALVDFFFQNQFLPPKLICYFMGFFIYYLLINNKDYVCDTCNVIDG